MKQTAMQLLLLTISSFAFMAGYAQVRSVSGKVLSEAGEELSGTTITIEDVRTQQKNYITSDDAGLFTLTGLSVNEKYNLYFEHVGYQPETLTNYSVLANETTTLLIRMKAEKNSLEEVVVVGYGTQRRRDLTGSVASIRAADIEKMPQTTVTQSLQGRVAGLFVSTTASNAEGNSNTMQIRGRNSITASNSPLIVLDGVPFSDQLSEINPNDIASIEVLKDASSAAIYGSRAANGVILITTKKGSSGKLKIGYNGYYGVDKIAHLPDMMNGEQFYQTKVDRFGENALTPTEINSHTNGISTDWVKLATRTGRRIQHGISVDGGTDKTHYYLSGTYNKIEGIAKNDKFDRYTIRINFDNKLASWLTLGTNTQLGYYDRSGLSASFENAFVMNPLAIPYEDNGNIKLTPWAEDPYFSNPLEGLNVQNNDITRSVITNNFLKVDIPFIPGLFYKINTGYNYRYRNIESYRGKNTRPGLQQSGVSDVFNWSYEDWLVENIVDYTKRIKEHNFNFTGLYSAQSRTTKNHDLNASGFPGDFMTNYQNRLATVWAPADLYEQRRYVSQMARLNYSYLNRYLLTATVRRDGYSAFGEFTKFGVFPSIALGWNISDEKFMSDASFINTLKLRLSYGRNGNQAINPYRTLAELTNQNYIGNNGVTAIGFYPAALGDPSLGWETTNKANLGIDFLLFNRLSGTIDYYFSKTYDLLLNKAISPVNGSRNILQNIGEVKNKGFEITLSGKNIEKKDFTWTTDFNFSFYRNKIVDVGLFDENGNPTDDIINRWFIGKPISVNYSYVFDGIWQEGDDIAHSAQPKAKPGDVRIKDLNGDTLINNLDRTIIGSRVPSFIAGLTNNLNYKNVYFSFLITTVQGVTRYNDFMNTYFDGRNAAMNRVWWTKENKINSYPANRDDSNPFGVNYYPDASDASYIRLNDVTLGYNFSNKLLERLKLNRLEVYANAKNLLTITKWKGLDPELDEQTGIPLTRAYLVGLRFGF